VRCGAIGTASYASVDCVKEIQRLAAGVPIRHALDCITDARSAAICFAALGRTGGRYACLEALEESWRTRRAVKVKVVMGFEMQGVDVDLGHDVYTRKARPELHALGMVWTKEMQALLDAGAVITPPIRELEGGFEGIIAGLHMLQAGEIRGEKLVARLSV
jgi:NADPH:quinone reductase-like Zn-dependent oxidoreductase